MLKLTSIHNVLPPINTHSKSSLDDMHGVSTNGHSQISPSSKQPQTRRQQSIERPRRPLLRNNRVLTLTGNKYVTTTTTPTIAPSISPPFVSSLSPTRSPSIVHNRASVHIEPTKINYRSSDNIWHDPTNTSLSQLRFNGPIKIKTTAPIRRSTNEPFYEHTAVSSGKSGLQIPSLPSFAQQQQYFSDDINNEDLLLSSTTKTHQATRRRHTNSFLDKSLGTTDYSSLMRKDSNRSSLLTNSIRPGQISSKDRNYVNSKTSFYEVTEKDIGPSGSPDENTFFQQQQQQPPQMNSFPSTQRLYGSTLDLTSNRKPFSPNKSRSFNVPTQPDFYSSTQDFSNNDRNDLAHLIVRGAIPKEQMVPTIKNQQISVDPTTSTAAAVVSNTPGERHPSAQSYKSRDPNQSYAYTDVQKYIEENELLPLDRRQSIQNWIIDVEKHRHLMQKIE